MMDEKTDEACDVVDGVGTRLAELIPDWALANETGCQCKRFECTMNRWGVDVCMEQRALIVDHLVKQSSHLIPAFRSMPRTAHRVAAKALVMRAIRNETHRLSKL